MADGWTHSLTFRGETFQLGEGETSAGRSKTCDVTIGDPSVSRKHVILRPLEGSLLVKDLGSSNGTFINGRRVQAEDVLEDGDVLALGDAETRVSITNPSLYGTQHISSVGQVTSVAPQHGEATFFLQAESMKLAEIMEAGDAQEGAPSPTEPPEAPASIQQGSAQEPAPAPDLQNPPPGPPTAPDPRAATPPIPTPPAAAPPAAPPAAAPPSAAPPAAPAQPHPTSAAPSLDGQAPGTENPGLQTQRFDQLPPQMLAELQASGMLDTATENPATGNPATTQRLEAIPGGQTHPDAAGGAPSDPDPRIALQTQRLDLLQQPPPPAPELPDPPSQAEAPSPLGTQRLDMASLDMASLDMASLDTSTRAGAPPQPTGQMGPPHQPDPAENMGQLEPDQPQHQPPQHQPPQPQPHQPEATRPQPPQPQTAPDAPPSSPEPPPAPAEAQPQAPPTQAPEPQAPVQAYSADGAAGPTAIQIPSVPDIDLASEQSIIGMPAIQLDPQADAPMPEVPDIDLASEQSIIGMPAIQLDPQADAPMPEVPDIDLASEDSISVPPPPVGLSPDPPAPLPSRPPVDPPEPSASPGHGSSGQLAPTADDPAPALTGPALTGPATGSGFPSFDSAADLPSFDPGEGSSPALASGTEPGQADFDAQPDFGAAPEFGHGPESDAGPDFGSPAGVPAPPQPPPPQMSSGFEPVGQPLGQGVDVRPLVKPLSDSTESFHINFDEPEGPSPYARAGEIASAAPSAAPAPASFDAPPSFDAPASFDAGPSFDAAPPAAEALPTFDAPQSFDTGPPSFDAPPSFDSPAPFAPAQPLAAPAPGADAFATAPPPATEPPSGSPSPPPMGRPPLADGPGNMAPPTGPPDSGPPLPDLQSPAFGPGTEVPPPAPYDQPGFDHQQFDPPQLDSPQPDPPPLDPSAPGPARFDQPTAPAGPALPPVTDPPPPGGGLPPTDLGYQQTERQASANLLPTLDDLTSSATPLEARPPQPVYESSGAFAHVATAQIPTVENNREIGFGLRLLAALLDLVLFGGLAFAGWLVTQDLTVAVGAFVGLGSVAILLGWALAGTSPGKKALGIEVQDQEGNPRLGFLRAAIRGAGCIVCILTLGVGFAMAAFSKDRRGLHDRIAGTQVRRS